MIWTSDWSLGIPLLVLTTVFHVCMFVLMENALSHIGRSGMMGHGRAKFIVVIALTALGAAALHGFEAAIWTVLYLSLGALPDVSTAMLYSLSAITSYGHSSLFLEDHWKLLGAIEAMNGLIMFGVTTAFLFAAISQMRPSRTR